MARLSKWACLAQLLWSRCKSSANLFTEPRQAGGLAGIAGSITSLTTPKVKAFKIEEIKAQTTVPGAKRVRIVYGPYKLKAAGVRLTNLLH
jgi:hypothetical protein